MEYVGMEVRSAYPMVPVEHPPLRPASFGSLIREQDSQQLPGVVEPAQGDKQFQGALTRVARTPCGTIDLLDSVRHQVMGHRVDAVPGKNLAQDLDVASRIAESEISRQVSPDGFTGITVLLPAALRIACFSGEDRLPRHLADKGQSERRCFACPDDEVRVASPDTIGVESLITGHGKARRRAVHPYAVARPRTALGDRRCRSRPGDELAFAVAGRNTPGILVVQLGTDDQPHRPAVQNPEMRVHHRTGLGDPGAHLEAAILEQVKPTTVIRTDLEC